MTKTVNPVATLSKNDVEIIARETVYRGFFRLMYTVFAIACLTAR